MTKAASRASGVGRVCNRGGVQDTERRLDHRPDFQGFGRICFGQKISHVIDIRRLFHLRQQDCVRPTGKNKLQIRPPLRRGEGIDANNGLAAEKRGFRKQGFQILPRLALHVGRYRIFQIEDHPVTIEISNFLQRPDVDRGDRKQRTARLDRNIFGKTDHAALVSSFCDICKPTIH